MKFSFREERFNMWIKNFALVWTVGLEGRNLNEFQDEFSLWSISYSFLECQLTGKNNPDLHRDCALPKNSIYQGACVLLHTFRCGTQNTQSVLKHQLERQLKSTGTVQLSSASPMEIYCTEYLANHTTVVLFLVNKVSNSSYVKLSYVILLLCPKA